jgi:hypothetical protein
MRSADGGGHRAPARGARPSAQTRRTARPAIYPACLRRRPRRAPRPRRWRARRPLVRSASRIRWRGWTISSCRRAETTPATSRSGRRSRSSASTASASRARRHRDQRRFHRCTEEAADRGPECRIRRANRRRRHPRSALRYPAPGGSGYADPRPEGRGATRGKRIWQRPLLSAAASNCCCSRTTRSASGSLIRPWSIGPRPGIRRSISRTSRRRART